MMALLSGKKNLTTCRTDFTWYWSVMDRRTNRKKLLNQYVCALQSVACRRAIN